MDGFGLAERAKSGELVECRRGQVGWRRVDEVM
jgi:hypothetical protein